MVLEQDEHFVRWLERWNGHFDWDRGNYRKNEKHGVTAAEIQGIFEAPVYVAGRIKDPTDEKRYLLLGEGAGKGWALVVTTRGEKLRVISCRRQRKKEGIFYENIKGKEA